ncbi:MAG: tetratricopeptide repeat protein [Bacteroidota bacterium]|nr:tetratricopeptide repeat protein [Bacteroidota bacterium]
MANALKTHSNSALLDRLRDEVEAVIVADQVEGLKKSKAYHRAAEDAADAMHQALALKYIAYCFFHRRELDKALSFGNNAKEVAFENGLPGIVQSMMSFTGMVLRHLGRIEESIQTLTEAVSYPGESPEVLAGSYNNLAVIYDTKEEFEKALKFYKKALQHMEDKASPNYPFILGNIGRCLLSLKDYRESKVMLDESLLLSQKCNNTIAESRSHQYLGLYYFELKDFVNCRFHLEEALSLVNKAGHIIDKLRISFHLSHVYEHTDQIAQAEDLIKESLDVCRELQPIHKELVIKRALDFYQNQGKPNIALGHAKDLLEIVGAREIDKRERRISELQMQFESKEKDREIETLQRERDHQEALLAQARLTEEANIKLEKANEELRQFTYAVSHDLKEPIRQVKNYAHIALTPIKDKLSPKEATMVQFVLDGSHRAHQMIDDLYSFATVGEGEQKKEEVSLLSLAQDSIVDLADKIKASGAEIDLKELPTVRGHKSMLRQLFLNLISNALKFAHPDRRLRITLDTGADGAVVIADNGLGIPQEAQAKIFSLFQQVDRQKEGSGIGLALCAKIMQKHNGRIAVTSDGHSGTSFRLIFS